MSDTERKTLIVDIEVYKNCLLVGMYQVETGKTLIFEESHRSKIDRDRLRKILMSHTFVGFNSMGYDAPLLWLFLSGASMRAIKDASDKIIKGRVRWWEVEDLLEISIPWEFKQHHIDLIEPQPNPIAGLKILHGRMHGKQLRDLPYDPAAELTFDEIDMLTEYLHNDLEATLMLWNALDEPMALRKALSKDFGMDLRSKSDSQIGLAIIKKRVEEHLGRKITKPTIRPGTSFKYTAPDYIKFTDPFLQDILRKIQEHDFIIQDDGKVDLPKWLDQSKITIGPSNFQMGIGGLHSTEANRRVVSDAENVIVTGDVASFYPEIILSLGLYPAATGPSFLTVYQEIKLDRLRAKKAKDKVRDKGFKIALNGGGFGNLGQRFSITYAPHLMIAVTLTGQLSLLMLIERASLAGIPVISANTDGAEFFCPREFYAGVENTKLKPSRLSEITEQWEADTKYTLEFDEYSSLNNSSVNCYYAIKASGGHKRKGPIGNPWNLHPDDFDPVRGQLMKNPQMTICSDAALACIKEGTPVEQTIRTCRDIRQFVTVIKAAKGASWRGDYLGKTVRYYWGIGGEPIIESEPHATTGNFKKIPKSDGAIECMRLPDEFPDDIDYAKYIAEAESILTDVGFYGDIIEPVKPIRLTKANRLPFINAWLLCG